MTYVKNVFNLYTGFSALPVLKVFLNNNIITLTKCPNIRFFCKTKFFMAHNKNGNEKVKVIVINKKRKLCHGIQL